MEKVKNQVLIDVDQITDVGKMVQIIELLSHKLNLKTVSCYAKDNGLSYNGVKKFRNKITIGGVKFVCDKVKRNNFPFQ